MTGRNISFYISMMSSTALTPVDQPAEIEQVVPPRINFPTPVSASKTILDDYHVEFVPSSQEVFSYEQNDTIDFKFGDNVSSINFDECYLRFVVTYANVPADHHLNHDAIGIRALVKTLQLSTVNGNTHFIDSANNHRVEIVKQALYGSREMTDFYRSLGGSACKSGTNTIQGVYDQTNEVIPLSKESLGSAIAVTYDTVVTAAPYHTLEFGGAHDVCPGDLLVTASATVRAIGVQHTDLISTRVYGIAYGGGVPVIGEAVSLIRNGVRNGATNVTKLLQPTGSTDTITGTLSREYVFWFDHDILKLMFPLFVIPGGLRLRMQLEHPLRCFVLDRPDDVGENFTYSISNPRLLARMVLLHPNIRNAIRNTYNTNRGLQMAVSDTRVITLTTSGLSNTESLEAYAGLRSVQAAVMYIQDSVLSENTTSLGLCNPSLSHALRDGITEFYVTAGSRKFPDRELYPDSEGRELFELIQQHRKRWMGENFASYLEPSALREDFVYFVDATDPLLQVRDTRYGYFVIDFSRAARPLGWLTGLDLTKTPLIFHLKRDGPKSSHKASGDRYDSPANFAGSERIYIHVLYDKLITLSASKIAISE